MLLTRVWGAVSLLLGAVACAPLSVALLVGRVQFAAGHLLYFAAVNFVFVAPAILYLLTSIQLHRRREWAITAGIVIAAFHGVCAVIGLLGLIVLTRVTGFRFVIAPAAGAVLFIAATTHLIYTLSHAFDAPRGQGGFDVVDPATRS